MESAARTSPEPSCPPSELDGGERIESDDESHGDTDTDTGDSTDLSVSVQDVKAPSNDNDVTNAPPYWAGGGRHIRSVSYHSIGQQRPHPILLEDHSEEDHELSQGCWAKSATVDEYVLVSGPTGIGAYVVWHCTVQTLKGGDMTIRKRHVHTTPCREVVPTSLMTIGR